MLGVLNMNRQMETKPCDHEWDEPDFHPDLVATFDCKKCGIHVACNITDPDDHHKGGESVLCGDTYELCEECERPRDGPAEDKCEGGYKCRACGAIGCWGDVSENHCDDCPEGGDSQCL